ncbi:hypothetical protein GA707_11425 [Nostocoides sp. F2B08]|uniref:hypothetical protein n=1 Tax=Nostocoides sp. F2B08 TaxID=2653936 RepID=UPI001262D62D|nr:hypothetical protein [Tetrasphaera sp. F2B08]KAB7744063.1 hypothetical protein GA707_11425 [Tetrasphaera sp. F2B08]
MPQALMWVFLLVTSVVGVWVSEWTATFSIALGWNIVNTIVLTIFLGLAVQEAVRLRRHTPEVAEPEADPTPEPATAHPTDSVRRTDPAQEPHPQRAPAHPSATAAPAPDSRAARRHRRRNRLADLVASGSTR